MTTAQHLGTPVLRIRALCKTCDSGESGEAVAGVTLRDSTDPVVGQLIGLDGQTEVLIDEAVATRGVSP